MKQTNQQNRMIKRYCILCVIFVCMWNIPSYGQMLTKAQMLADLNFLQGHVNEYCYFVPLLEQRTGVSVNAEFDQLKQTITGPEPIDKFIYTVRTGLNFLNDWHTGIANKWQILMCCTPNYYLSPLSNATVADTLHATYYQRLITDSIYGKVKCGIWIKYLNGKYYNIRSFTYKGIPVQSGEKISAIDGIPINRFINKYRNQMLFPLWDPVHKQWYEESFIYALPEMGMQKFSLTIGNKKINIDCAKPMDNLQKIHAQSHGPKMLLINNDILYIDMPSMFNANWYINEFLHIYISSIKKIIIDIRNNGGGSDGVWQDLLKKIIDKPLKYRYCVGMKHNAILEKAVSSFGTIKVEGSNAILTQDVTLRPDSNSVHFNGKIYVLQNQHVYSAAAALSSVALQERNMVLVGEPIPVIAGYTLPPILFKLPNSGIAFELAFSADLSGGKKNPYMDKVEVPVNLSLKEYLDMIFHNDYHSDDFLRNKDKLIQYVKEH
ncbi:S41 family peptidase [Microbacter margulisiae]|uniref:Tail specific protease domain-containing protein n=1 Tax=Microbacter margulisiae TaxID=1350067 RepID=A0A7W5DRY1_9PORP|nr:S41 family peptidase [Microbacter margulisiae]MBB3187643.1 hypothetical protein [Microbacter margulisiae]